MTTTELTNQPSSESIALERTRYFSRQLVTPDDLTQDQDYFRAKLRRHNRLLHGWGVVCGALVKKGDGNYEIVIEPGYILGPYGDEIVIDHEVTVELSQEGPNSQSASPCGEVVDPWCTDVQVEAEPGQTLYVAVRYEGFQLRPVQVHPDTCSCEQTVCEYSRIRDSFAIGFLTSLPSTYNPMPSPEDPLSDGYYMEGELFGRPCPPCPTEPWVILADVTLGADGEIMIGFADRRYVASFANYYDCPSPTPKREVVPSSNMEQLIDQTAMRLALAPPSALVSAVREDGTPTYIPLHFTVEPGESFKDLLGREGDRKFYDPVSNETFTLAELYAMTSVDATETLRGNTDALAPLEGLKIDTAKLRGAWASLEPLLDERGTRHLEKKHLASPARASMLPAIDIHGVSPQSQLGKKLADMTIGDVAEISLEDFLALARKGVAKRRLTSVERQARIVWERATKAEQIARVWRNRT